MNVDRTNITDLSEVEERSAKTSSLVDRLKDKIKGLNKSKNSQDSDDAQDADSDSAAAQKKKKSKMLQIAIGVGLVLFLLSDYIIPPEEEAKAPEEATSFKRPERKKPVKEPTEEAPTEVATEAPAQTEPSSEVPTETPSETVTTETTPDSPVTVTSEPAPSETEAPTDVVETPPVVTAPTENPEIDLTVPDNSPATVDSVDGTDTAPKSDENLTDQILQDLEKQAKKDQVKEQKKEYVSPPDYEYRGRGLVYNCKGKHWACIDAPSYKTCEDNASSVKYLNKKTECHPFNVYETPRGCENMQNRMVSSSAKTSFCNE